MARLHEYQGKQQLAKEGVLTPHGAAATTPDTARAIAAEIGRPVMVKAQVWVTGRAGLGAIRKPRVEILFGKYYLVLRCTIGRGHYFVFSAPVGINIDPAGLPCTFFDALAIFTDA